MRANPAGQVRPYTPPLIRSIAAPVGRLIPSRSGPKEAPAQHFATENMTDRGNPYAAGGGCDYGPVASVHNAAATGAPVAPRTAIGSAYITPPGLWNLAGVAAGFLQVVKGPRQTIRLATGRWTPVQASGVRPLPSIPEPARMLQPRQP